LKEGEAIWRSLRDKDASCGLCEAQKQVVSE
jgi:hypothetical protein